MDSRERNDIMPVADAQFQFFNIDSHWLAEGEKRFDAEYYAKDTIAARVLIEKLTNKGILIEKIEDFATRIFWPGRFKRSYSKKIEGLPFFTPTESFLFLPKTRKYLSESPTDVIVQPNWILITRSGTIGRCLITTNIFKNSVLSDDLIRIIPKKDSKFGYLYAYLNTWMGQAYLTKNQYGATVKHIEPHQIVESPVPRINKIEQEVHDKITEAFKLREEAQNLLIKAEDCLYKELKLPIIDEIEQMFIPGFPSTNFKVFEISSEELNERFDASYHIPIIRQIEKNLAESHIKIDKLGDKIEKISLPPRFKRPYVKKNDNGIRYIRPSDLPLIKTFNKLYLAKLFKNSNLYKLHEGELLIVTDGTIGWVSIVTKVIAGNYGSNNFARVTCNSELDSGYLLAYLQSPYGQYQLKREIYGGVIDHLIEDHITNVKVPIPSSGVQKKIGKIIIEAFTKRDQANILEQYAIELIEKTAIQISNN